MRGRDDGPRWCAVLLGAALLAGCYSPSDSGHRIYGYVDSQGRIAIEPAFLDARAFSDGLAAVRVAGGWGYVDRDGRWVIPPRYVAAASFAEGRAAVSDERGLWGYVDTTGRVVVPPRFQRASRFIDGRAYGLLPDGQVESIDLDGRTAASTVAEEHATLGDVSQEFESEWRSSDPDPDLTLDRRRTDRAMVEAAMASDRLPVSVEVKGDNRVGYDDLAGRRVIEPTFEEAGPFIEGLARVKSAAGYGFIRPDGSVAVTPEFDSALLRFSRGRTLAVSDGRAWLIDTTGRRVADLGPWEWPEMAGEEGFDDLERYIGLDDFFADGLIPWQRNGKWGYVDRDGRWAIDPHFDAAQPFQHGLASVTQGGSRPLRGPFDAPMQGGGGRAQLIDTHGRIVRDVGNATIAPPDRGFVRIGTEMRWGFAPADGGRPGELPFATRRLVFAGASFVDHRPLDFSEDRALVSRFAMHRWLLVDEQGRTQASAELEWLEGTGDGMYAFVVDQRWGLADARLRTVSAGRFDAKPSFDGDPPAAMVIVGTRSGCIDRRGRWLLEFDLAALVLDDCSGRLLPAANGFRGTQDSLIGVVDLRGRWRIPAQFDDVTRLPGPPGADFFLLGLGKQRSLAAVDAHGWRRSEPADLATCDHADACFACGADGCRRLDPSRLRTGGPAYDEVESGASEGDVMVRRGSLWGYRRAAGRLSLPIQYEEIDPIFAGRADSDAITARVRRDGRWGVASLDTGRLLVPARYEQLNSVGGGRHVVRDGSGWGIVAADGRVLVPPRYEEIRAVRGDLLLAKEKDGWVLVTVDGRTLADPPPDWVQGIYALADFSERTWAALTQDARLYVVDKRSLAVREVLAPVGYRWCTTACFSSSELYSGDFDGDLPVEAEGRPRRYVLLDSEGRSMLPRPLEWVRDIGPLGAGAGPYVVWAAGRCGMVTREGRWIAPLAYDHCDASGSRPGSVLLGQEAYPIPSVTYRGP